MIRVVVLLQSVVLLSALSAQESSVVRASSRAAGGGSGQEVPAVTAPPESFFEKVRERDRDAARKFYKKYVDVKGMPVVASAEVADEALQRTHYLVTHLLAGRPDILQAMAKHGTRLIIIGKDQVYTDMPEYRNHPDPAFQNERVRGTGGLDITSFGEENLLNLPLDRYDDESIAVHEFCHTIDAALSRIDPAWRERLVLTYRSAMSKGLWKNAYTSSNPSEYWAEICQSYFDCNRVNKLEPRRDRHARATEAVRPRRLRTGQGDVQANARERLALPSGGAAAERDRAAGQVQDRPVLHQVHLRARVHRTGIEARERRGAAQANDTIRKMFTYRHDILKAMIADGARLVVLGRKEKLRGCPKSSVSL